jgi:hypothetical protein
MVIKTDKWTKGACSSTEMRLNDDHRSVKEKENYTNYFIFYVRFLCTQQ